MTLLRLRAMPLIGLPLPGEYLHRQQRKKIRRVNPSRKIMNGCKVSISKYHRARLMMRVSLKKNQGTLMIKRRQRKKRARKKMTIESKANLTGPKDLLRIKMIKMMALVL